MSNMIKAYSVRYDEEIKKTIDSHLRIDKEIEVKRNTIFTAIGTHNDFVEGLSAIVIESLPTQEEIVENNTILMDHAKNEAKQILDQAKKEAEQIKKDAFASAQKKGFDEGTQQAKREAQKLEAEYEEKERHLIMEYEAMTLAMEPQMAEIIASLLKKITGILVEDKEEVILYLVHKALMNMDKSGEYTIKVSKEDYESISMRKNNLLSEMGREVSLYIIEDPSLMKNQCRIETDLRIIDCSLDMQLNNLIMDLRLLSSI